MSSCREQVCCKQRYISRFWSCHWWLVLALREVAWKQDANKKKQWRKWMRSFTEGQNNKMMMTETGTVSKTYFCLIGYVAAGSHSRGPFDFGYSWTSLWMQAQSGAGHSTSIITCFLPTQSSFACHGRNCHKMRCMRTIVGASLSLRKGQVNVGLANKNMTVFFLLFKVCIIQIIRCIAHKLTMLHTESWRLDGTFGLLWDTMTKLLTWQDRNSSEETELKFNHLPNAFTEPGVCVRVTFWMCRQNSN